MASDSPALPVAYDLKHLPEVDNLRHHVRKVAMEGGEEGTIILSDRVRTTQASQQGQTVPDGRSGNLHAALILEPEHSAERDHEILFVALVSLANAIAVHASPLTALRFGWPSEIRIASYRIGEVQLDRGVSTGRRWLTITSSVNVAYTPDTDDQEQMSLHQGEGNDEITPMTLFESWAREFIRWINLWDERGFLYVLSQWKARAEIRNCPVSIRTPDRLIQGVGVDVDDMGCLIVRGEEGEETKLSARLFLGWE